MTTKKCPHCVGENQEKAIKCKYCGEKFTEISPFLAVRAAYFGVASLVLVSAGIAAASGVMGSPDTAGILLWVLAPPGLGMASETEIQQYPFNDSEGQIRDEKNHEQFWLARGTQHIE